MEFLHQEITEQIIGAAIEVWKNLGYGFLEKVYQRAMLVELGLRGVGVEAGARINVHYKGRLVGEYFADLFAQECVITELKVAEKYNSADEAQLLNELKETGIKIGLLINFGRQKAEVRRFIY